MKTIINPMRFFTGIISPEGDPVKAGIPMDNGVLSQSHEIQRRIAYPLSPILSFAKVLMPDSWRLSMQERARQRVPFFCDVRIRYSFTMSKLCVFPKMIDTDRPCGPNPSASITISQPRGQLSSEKRASCRGNCTIFVQSLQDSNSGSAVNYNHDGGYMNGAPPPPPQSPQPFRRRLILSHLSSIFYHLRSEAADPLDLDLDLDLSSIRKYRNSTNEKHHNKTRCP